MNVKTGLNPANYPRKLYQAPKAASTTHSRAPLTIEEKAARYDQLEALHLEALATQQELDRLRFRLMALAGERDALLTGVNTTNSQGARGKEVCGLCGFSNCVCERIGG